MKNNFKNNIFAILLVSFVIFTPVFLFAQEHVPAPINDSAKINNPINVSTISEFIKIILINFIKIGIPIIALALVYCGFLFVSARGNSEAIKKAKDALIYTCIGAAILLGSWAIAQLISETVLQL